MLKINSIQRRSTADKVGLKVDDVITQFNDSPALDMLDVAYFDSQAQFSVTVARGDKSLTFNVRKDVNEPMG